MNICAELIEKVPGDSGAWVVRDGGLCGHIIARRGRDTSFAYMLPVQVILDDIKRDLGVKEVRLLEEWASNTLA